MFTRIKIQNFRTFNELEISDLGRINLFTGANNSGKTSLLEALFLLSGAGNPHLVLNSNVLRGFDQNATLVKTMSTDLQRDLWKELFPQLDVSKTIEVAGDHDSLGKLTMEISLERPSITKVAHDANGNLSATNFAEERVLAIRFSNSGTEQNESQIRLTAQGFEFSPPSSATASPPAILLLSRTSTIQDDARRLGKLRTQKRGGLLLDALRVVEPKLIAIEDNTASGAPMLWGDVGLSELVPLPVMGEGMTRIARLVLAISSVPHGAVLVDEVENGLHHSILQKVWKVIDVAAREFNTQIFATSHSLECAAAAHNALAPRVFRLHRLEAGDAKCRCVTYEPESIDAAFKHDLEVR